MKLRLGLDRARRSAKSGSLNNSPSYGMCEYLEYTSNDDGSLRVRSLHGNPVK